MLEIENYILCNLILSCAYIEVCFQPKKIKFDKIKVYKFSN